MENRRGRPSDERRRRVILDDSRLGETEPETAEEPATEPRAKSTRRGRSYPEDAVASRQMRITDLLPKSAWAILAMAIAIALLATGIHFAHLQRELLVTQFGASGRIFDVDQAGSLGHGLSVLLTAGATLACFLIYALRRHKMDDYRGHYGIWLWAALVMSVLSIVEYTGVDGILEALALQHAPIGLVSRMPLVVHSIVALGALLFLARLGAEMQQSHAALAVLALLLGAVGVVVALEAGWRPQGIELPAELLAFHARLLSRGLLLLMLLVYGRYTRLDALGAIKVREKKPRKKAAVAAEKPTSGKAAAEKPAAKEEKPASMLKNPAPTTVAAEKPAPKPVERLPEKQSEKPISLPAKAPAAIITAPKPMLTLGQKPSDEDENEEGGSGRLSRAERRRLKQLGKAA